MSPWVHPPTTFSPPDFVGGTSPRVYGQARLWILFLVCVLALVERSVSLVIYAPENTSLLEPDPCRLLLPPVVPKRSTKSSRTTLSNLFSRTPSFTEQVLTIRPCPSRPSPSTCEPGLKVVHSPLPSETHSTILYVTVSLWSCPYRRKKDCGPLLS